MIYSGYFLWADKRSAVLFVNVLITELCLETRIYYKQTFHGFFEKLKDISSFYACNRSLSVKSFFSPARYCEGSPDCWKKSKGSVSLVTLLWRPLSRIIDSTQGLYRLILTALLCNKVLRISFRKYVLSIFLKY